MSHDRLQKIRDLVNRATSPTGNDDKEAASAAVKACHILRKYPELLAARVASAASGPAPPPKPEKPSNVHPDAALLREWRAMMAAKKLVRVEAKVESICADCGSAIAVGSKVIFREASDLMTHYECRAWWWNFEVRYDEPDDGIPF